MSWINKNCRYNATVPRDSRLTEYIHNGDHNNVAMHVTTTAYVLNRLERLTTEDLSHTLNQMQHDEMEEQNHQMEKRGSKENVSWQGFLKNGIF